MSSIYDTFDYGYDPRVPEPAPLTTPPQPATPPPTATVNDQYLPPVGQQTMPNCFVWSTIYGLATFWAAQAGNYLPTETSQQASPDYSYIQVEVSTGVPAGTTSVNISAGQSTATLQSTAVFVTGNTAVFDPSGPNPETFVITVTSATVLTLQSGKFAYDHNEPVNVVTCVGGLITAALNWLINNKGTPSLASAPNLGPGNGESSCAENWLAYGTANASLPADSIFAIPGFKAISVGDGSVGLDNVRAIIVSGVPLAYGTYLYADFPDYDGTSPYVGNGIWLKKPNGERAGHCMMIIGYDDTMIVGDNQPPGAVWIQNSFGAKWGSQGFVWMAYATFQAMAQGRAFYISS